MFLRSGSDGSFSEMRPGMRAIAIVVLPVAIAVASSCVVSQRALGEDCLKDQDCLSGICSQLQCAAAPPLLDAAAPTSTPDTGAPDTGTPDTGTPDTGAADAFVAPDGPADTGNPDVVAPGEAAADSTSPAADSSTDSGSSDATSD
jgi:hypothetical protein